LSVFGHKFSVEVFVIFTELLNFLISKAPHWKLTPLDIILPSPAYEDGTDRRFRNVGF
jgi:hypothetical protein